MGKWIRIILWAPLVFSLIALSTAQTNTASLANNLQQPSASQTLRSSLFLVPVSSPSGGPRAASMGGADAVGDAMPDLLAASWVGSDGSGGALQPGRGCPTHTTLLTSGTSFVTEDITFLVTVNAQSFCRNQYNSCSGEVFLYDFATQIGLVSTGRGCAARFDINSLTIGKHKITATYQAGDGYNAPSSAHIAQIVNPFPSAVTLSSSPNPSLTGEEVIFTATVNSDAETPTGKVRFSDGTNAFGIATLDENGVATFTKKNLALGSHSITAEYYGDGLLGKSTSLILNQVVTSP